jgi:CBS domain containing-hemolysin-like protein
MAWLFLPGRTAWTLLSGWLLLFLAGILLATLHAAFLAAGAADPSRLTEKFPGARARLSRWLARWDILRHALLIASMTVNVLLIAGAVRLLFAPGRSPSWPLLAAAGLVVVLLFPMLLVILPRALSRNFADRICIVFLPTAILLTRLVWPLAWVLRGIEQYWHAHLSRRSDEDDHPTPEEAIRSLVNQVDSMNLEEEEREIIRSVFEFGETITREIMVPRIDMEGLEDVESIEACIRQTRDSGHSRFPVFHENLDDILGMVHVKDLLHWYADQQGSQRVINIAKTIPFVPESMPINDLLQLLRTEQAQMAIVVDEYGGTAGLVTVEDIIEELVGEIQDEYDRDETTVRRLSDGSAMLDARRSVEETNERLNIHIPTGEEYDSLGGYLFHELERIPRPGETIEKGDFRITVQTASARRLHKLRIQARRPGEHPGHGADRTTD